jgi:hypothetical protein
MRQVFFLFLSLVVIGWFFPELMGKFEAAIAAFLDVTIALFSRAGTTLGA